LQKQINNEFETLDTEIIACRKCPRLVRWREKIAREKTRRFSDWDYWGRPVAGFGDITGRLWIVGLAPAAHGANRTGRMFTGDRSGDFLYRALYKVGFANQHHSANKDDGLYLNNCYVSALIRCAPPANKPTKNEFSNCQPYLETEFQLLKNKRIILCLGQLAFSHMLKLLETNGYASFKPRPKFHHGLELKIDSNLRLITSYHPSQQNTFTGKLTEEMFDAVFQRIGRILSLK
jgi:uracil-DNA glycosylase family 4